MIVLLDLHDTLVDLHPKWLYFYQSKFGRHVLPQELRTYARQPYADWLSVLQIPGFLRDLPLKAGALEAVRELERYHEVYVVSSPPAWTAASDVYAYFHSVFRVPGILTMDRLILARSKERVRGDVLVDDRGDNLVRWAAVNGGRPIVFDAPWNQGYCYERCATWPAVLEAIQR